MGMESPGNGRTDALSAHAGTRNAAISRLSNRAEVNTLISLIAQDVPRLTRYEVVTVLARSYSHLEEVRAALDEVSLIDRWEWVRVEAGEGLGLPSSFFTDENIERTRAARGCKSPG